MIILIDLDGTLVNTASISFKPMKDGLVETNVATIPLFNGAKEFIAELIKLGHTPIILSDSHFKYVNPIAQQIFNLPSLSLCDKPNSKKTLDFLSQKGFNVQSKEDFILIGDTWLDIELGRALNIKTILTQFYTTNEVDERDGIGKAWHQLKSGPTYVVKQFNHILNILKDPVAHMWASEAIFHNKVSKESIKLHDSNSNGHTLFRSLGRQEVGECDKYGIAMYYTEFQREGRTQENLDKLASAVNGYIKFAVTAAPNLHWDYITYVTDKSSTVPPDKMKNFFNLIEEVVPKAQLFKWADTVDGSIRNRVNYQERRKFINENLKVLTDVEIDCKSIIIIDDQFTSGSTAYEISAMLRKRGVQNVLFLTLFFMTSSVSSNRNCSKCGKVMMLKIKKSDGTKFFSCTPPQFRGNGCGHIEKIAQ
jgi:phosphoglycolate phosphatase-like HAD superfamily hydrolase